MTGEQIRAARALIGWKASDLASASGVSMPTIQRIDATRGPVPGRYETIEAIRIALEGAGVQFLESGHVATGPGVAMQGDK
jgi:transcriptional regulator with XRE-family HTH domain